MTEEDAKTKWCPFARPIFQISVNSVPTQFVSGNRGYDMGVIHQNSYCLGNACMAWRWQSDFNELTAKYPDKDMQGLRDIAHGYCGLAGKP